MFWPTVTVDAPNAHPADLPIFEGDLTDAGRALAPGSYPATGDYADLFQVDDHDARAAATCRGTVRVTETGAAFFDPDED